MCGIAGFVTTGQNPYPDSVLERMTASIAHRGPDGSGFFRDRHCSLGHRRLSIIDLSGGSQPMANEDGSLQIIYNGEVFNHADLRGPLERAGHRFSSRCDTEAIVHAYEQYGADCVTHLRGMFAFAIWDGTHQRLFCARDRLGIKPFYYFWDGRLFAFASEIKALLEHPAISPALEEPVLGEYLAFGYVSEERTLFAGIRQLLPGHHATLTVDAGGGHSRLEVARYWDAPAPAAAKRSDKEWIAECRSRLEETVRMRLMSDVPLGMFLSGGVDSSAIAALMKRMVTGPVETFAVGYREAAYSELDYARHVAGHLGVRHREVVIGKDDFFQALPQLIWHEDEPIVWPSSVSLYFVSRLAAQHVKVVLTGEGSDELFGGYSRYRTTLGNLTGMRYYQLVPAGLRASLRSLLAGSPLLSASLRRKLGHTFLGREDGLASLYLDNFLCAFPAEAQDSLLRTSPGPVYGNYLGYWESAAGRSPLGRLLYADQKTYLVELLMKQDRMSMACSIESRVPFLDHPLVEFAASVPDHLRIRGGTGKYILKRAVEDLLPREIIHRRKMGFPTPLEQWLSGPEAEPLLAPLHDPAGIVAAYTERAAVDQLIDRHQRGFHDATDRLWRLLNLQIWGDLYLTGRCARHWAGPAALPV